MTLPNPSPSVLDTDQKLNRYWNMRGIVESSSNAIVADILGKQNSQITAISGPAPTRAIGDQLVGEIERTFNLEPGHMDSPPDRRTTNDDPLIADVAMLLSAASEMDKRLVLDVTKVICGHSVNLILSMNSKEGKHKRINIDSLRTAMNKGGA